MVIINPLFDHVNLYDISTDYCHSYPVFSVLVSDREMYEVANVIILSWLLAL